MLIDLYGIVMETPGVTISLNTPWRAMALEQRLFEAVVALKPDALEKTPDEWLWHLRAPQLWGKVLNAVARVMKGWQEEGQDVAGQPQQRAWRWLMEADTDMDGYDHAGDKASMWAFLRASIDAESPERPEKGEDVDLNAFSVRIWSTGEEKE